MSKLDYRGLAALDAVATHGSFDKAAVALFISQSAVSQRIRALEEMAGRLLLVRSQPPQPTDLGQRMIAHYRQVKLMEAALEGDLGYADSLPEIPVAVNADSLATWFPEALAGLLAAHRCQVKVQVDDQDHTLRLLREGSVFACITSSTEPVAGTTATPLGVMRYVCVATPAFAAQWFAEGLTLEGVQRAPAVVFDLKDALHQRFLVQELGWDGPFPHHALPSSESFVRLIQAGLAYGMAPVLQVREALAAGQLIELKPGAGLDVLLVWHVWNIQTALTRALSERVIQTAGERLMRAD